METASDFILGGFKITADGDCSHEIQRRLLLGRKVMTNLDSILKSKDITLPTKVCLVEAMVFPAVMYGCESQTIKKAECQKNDAFELGCWRRWTFVGKVMSVLFNMLSRLVITFLPRSQRLLTSWLQSPSAVILEPKK